MGIREAIPPSNFTQVAIATDLCARLDALATTLAAVEVRVCMTAHAPVSIDNAQARLDQSKRQLLRQQ